MKYAQRELVTGEELERVLSQAGKFTWSFGVEFFVETEEGNYIWSDPDYGGNGNIYKYYGNYYMWCEDLSIPFGRDKGRHTIGAYTKRLK